MNYTEYNDQELLDYISENEEYEELIYKKYDPLINSYAKKYYPYCKNYGVEVSDLVQEGMLALNKAIIQYKETKNTTFYTFAKTCIERRMLNVIATTRRLKHKFLNESVSFDLTSNKDDSVSLENLFYDEKENPEFMIFSKENENDLLNEIQNTLTAFENQVFELKYNDFEYKEIAKILDKQPKAIDNALQRIRLKIKKILEKN